MNENNTVQPNMQNNMNNYNAPSPRPRFTQQSRTIVFMLIISVVCAIIFPMIIIDYYAGLNYSLCAFCLIGALVYLIVDSKDYKLPQLIFWTIIAIIYTSTFMRVRNEVYLGLSFVLAPILFTLMVYFSRKRKNPNAFPQLIETFFSPLMHGFKIIPAVSRIRTKSTKSKAFIEILVGILISIVLLVIILPLMFDADVQFANYINDWYNSIFDGFFDYVIAKIMLAVFIAVVYFGYLYMACANKPYPPKRTKQPPKGISANIIITVLSVVTFVYAVFTFSTMFTAITHSANNLPKGMSYTEYARSGFFQLAWLSAINFLLLLGAQFAMRNKGKKVKIVSKAIFTIQVIINLCLLGLSAYNMSLYSGAYGLTRLRILVYLILAYELVLLIALMYKVYREKFKFVTMATYFSFAFWAIVTLINIEAYAVDYNAKSLPVDKFDFGYACYSSSWDTSTVLKEYVMDNYDDMTNVDIDIVRNYYDIENYSYYIDNMFKRDWFEYNYSFNQHSKNRDEMIIFFENK